MSWVDWFDLDFEESNNCRETYHRQRCWVPPPKLPCSTNQKDWVLDSQQTIAGIPPTEVRTRDPDLACRSF